MDWSREQSREQRLEAQSAVVLVNMMELLLLVIRSELPLLVIRLVLEWEQ